MMCAPDKPGTLLAFTNHSLKRLLQDGSMDRADNGGAMPCLEAAEEGFRVVGSTVD